MRVLSMYGLCGDVEPIVELAVQLWALASEARVCAPPGCAELLAGACVPLVSIGVRQ